MAIPTGPVGGQSATGKAATSLLLYNPEVGVVDIGNMAGIESMSTRVLLNCGASGGRIGQAGSDT